MRENAYVKTSNNRKEIKSSASHTINLYIRITSSYSGYQAEICDRW